MAGIPIGIAGILKYFRNNILLTDFFEAILEIIVFSFFRFQTIDNLLRCSICYEYFDVAMIVPDCSHNCKFKFEIFLIFVVFRC